MTSPESCPEPSSAPDPQASNADKVRWATLVLLKQYEWLGTRDVIYQADIELSRTAIYQANAVLFDVSQKLEDPAPIPMLIWCPECGERHIDDEFENVPHALHACQNCGFAWRHAIERTVGVKFLPGYKDHTPPRTDQLRLRRRT